MSQGYSYYVSAVEYNSDNTHIAKLRVHAVTADKTFNAAGQELTRPQVIDLIKKGKTFASITKGTGDRWTIGAKLEIVAVTTEYLKTKNDTSTKDNLENLPLI